ncbi:hypothetical protein QQF64_023301 [Cirrhinus molitorella]|uniref:Uncharacterized protein n=1 Tax=Cirrhinus molitorella TaxID=172907 RepID=A0ABR3L4S8_9TELE
MACLRRQFQPIKGSIEEQLKGRVQGDPRIHTYMCLQRRGFLIGPERIPSVEFKKSSREFVAVAFLCMQIKEASFRLISLRKAVESELLCSPAGRLKHCQQCATLKRGNRAENQ